MPDFGESVLIHFVGTFDDGTEFANTHRIDQPVVLTIGLGQMIPKFEMTVADMLPGAKRQIRLEPEQAYGKYEEGLVIDVPKDNIGNADGLPVGEYVGLQTKLGPMNAKVLEIGPDTVKLDCNHELAGRAVNFDIELVSYVRESAIDRDLHPSGCACGCYLLKQALS